MASGSRAEIYLVEAYSKLRSLGAALALAGLFAVIGFTLLLAGAASYKYYVNATTGEPVENVTRAMIAQGLVREVTAVNTTKLAALLATGLDRASASLLDAAKNESLAYFGYAQLSLLAALTALLAAAALTRSSSIVLADYSKSMKAGVAGGWLKILGVIVLFIALWQFRGAVNEQSEPLLIGGLGLYYLGGALAIIGTLLFVIPFIPASRAIDAPGAMKAAAALAGLGALVTFTAVNTIQLTLGPALCLIAGLLYAIPASRVLRRLTGQLRA